MNLKRIAIAVIIIASLAVSACNLQFSTGGINVQTAVAQTVSAMNNVPNIGVVPPAGEDPVAVAVAKTLSAQTDLANIVAATLAARVSDTPVFTPTPSATPLPSLTFTPTGPTVSVSIATNCRTGPGKAYDMVGSLAVGQTAQVVGRSQDSQYWLIPNPSNPSKVCWLWGFYATVTGNTSGLPVATPPPTPTPQYSPTPVSAFTVSYVDVVHCGASYAFRFNVQNTGSTTWESIRMVITDNTSASTTTHVLDSFRSYSGCGVESNQQELMPGEGGHVANILPGELGYNPAGHSFTATITFCSANGLGGTCLSQTINFNP